MSAYVFKSFSNSLHLEVSVDGRKILNSHFGSVSDDRFANATPGLRTGAFDNQGSPRPWTWAWTTDAGPFEIWRPNGIYLSLNLNGVINLHKRRVVSINAPKELWIGKTGFISYGILARNFDGSKVSLIKDTYPFWDAQMNVTYDGLCEDEDFFPLLMMGRELSKWLQIPFDEQDHTVTGS